MLGCVTESYIKDIMKNKYLSINFCIIFCKILQEAAIVPPYVALAVRPNPGFWEFVKVNADDLSVDSITSVDYLKFKEMIFDENWYVERLELVTFISVRFKS